MAGYDRHVAFAAPARRSCAVYLTAAGFVLIEVLFGLGRDFLDIAAFEFLPGFIAFDLTRPSPIAVLYDLFSFGVLVLVVVGVVVGLHRRSARGLLIGAEGHGRGLRRDIWRATLGGVLVFAAMDMVFPWWGEEGLVMQSLGLWLAFLPVALLGLLVQTAAEELFYRGYLQQQIAARFSSPILWLGLPNIAFAAVHWHNGEVFADSVQYVIWAFAFGLAASDLTARSGTLGAAIGFHLANNIFAFLVVGEADLIDSGLSLFLLPPPLSGAEDVLAGPDMIVSVAFVADLAILALAWGAVRVAIKR